MAVSTKGKSRSTTRFSAWCTLVKSNWGIGMMSMPYFLVQAGWLFGLIFFVFTMIVTFLSVSRLLRCQAELERRRGSPLDRPTYTAVVGGALGWQAEVLSVACISLSCFGSCVAYLLFIGDNMEKFIGGKAWMWIIACSVPLALLAIILDDVAKLDRFGFVGLVCAVAFLLVLLSQLGNDDVSASVFSNTARINSDPSDLAIALGIAVFLNEGVVVVAPSLQATMPDPGSFLCPVMVLSLLFFTAVYSMCALAGFVLYGLDVNSDLSLSFEINTPNTVAMIFYACQLLPTFVVIYYICYECIEDIWMRFRHCSERGSKLFYSKYRLIAAWRIVGVATIAFLAITVPSFGDFVAFVGALAISLLVYVLPFSAYLRLHYCATGTGVGSVERNYSTFEGGERVVAESADLLDQDDSYVPPTLPKWDVALSVAIALLGVFVLVVGVYQSTYNLLYA